MAAGNNKVVGIKAEVLNDLASRFLINLSSEERDPIKLCTYIELAHWYYLDLMRPEDPSLPGCSLREFMRALFQHCPWLVDFTTQDLDTLISEWKNHKYSKPLRGAIILNQDLTKCLLVQGYTSGTSWGFPKGKLEEGEADVDAAVREVYEETGFDIRGLIGEESYLDASVRDTHVRMYLIEGVAENTSFEPKTRNEIKSIQWFNIKDLPSYRDKGSLQALGKHFMVIPFIGQLRKWIKNRKSKRKGISANLTGSNTTQSQTQSSPQSQQKEKRMDGSPKPKCSQTFPPAQSQQQTENQHQMPPQSRLQHQTLSQSQLQHQALLQSQLQHQALPQSQLQHQFQIQPLSQLQLVQPQFHTQHQPMFHTHQPQPVFHTLQPVLQTHQAGTAIGRSLTAPSLPIHQVGHTPPYLYRHSSHPSYFTNRPVLSLFPPHSAVTAPVALRLQYHGNHNLHPLISTSTSQQTANSHEAYQQVNQPTGTEQSRSVLPSVKQNIVPASSQQDNEVMAILAPNGSTPRQTTQQQQVVVTEMHAPSWTKFEFDKQAILDRYRNPLEQQC